MTNVVIGAGSGMGTAVAHALASRGHLLIADLDLESVEAVAKDIGGDVEAMTCDITNEKEIEGLMARVAELGDLDAFVISAGLSGSMAPGRRILEVNLVGTAEDSRGRRAPPPSRFGRSLLRVHVRIPGAAESGARCSAGRPVVRAVLRQTPGAGLRSRSPRRLPRVERGASMVRRLAPAWGAREPASCRYLPASTTHP